MKPSKQEKQLQTLLQKNPGPAIDQVKKQQSIALVCAAMDRKTIFSKQSFLRRLLRQASYISPFTWLTQFILVLFCGYLMRHWSPEVRLMTMSIIAPLVGLIGITEMLRSFSHNMWELEQSCRYDLRQVMSIKLLLMGTLDFLIISAFTFSSGVATNNMGLSILLVLVPFNLANTVYLLLLQHLPKRRANAWLVVAGITMAFMAFQFQEHLFIQSQQPPVYPIQWSAFWLIISLALLLLVGYYFFYQWNKEGTKKWNFGWTD